jgi:tRNA-2-methylthio-N6-dimethylallyladenosine synthase
VLLTTFGCQMNKLDSEIAEASLLRHGFRLVDRPEEAAAVIFNTCAVREHAEERVVSRLANLLPLKRERPGLVLGIAGCMAQEHGRAFLDRHPHVSLVAGTGHFPALGALVERALAGERVACTGAGRDPAAADRAPRPERVGPRAYVAAQRGCSMGCAYCIVPATRGPWRSRPVAEVLAECRRVLAAGARDITLLGQTVDAWGRDLRPRLPFAELLRRVHGLAGLERLHFLTSHPAFLDRETAACFDELEKLARWVHLPAQSGSDRVLAAMRRGYTVKRYLEAVDSLQGRDEEVAVASDFIVGFPGEREEDHRATLELMRRVGFSQCYIFRYSPRPGTAAAALEGLPDDVVRRRHREALALHEELAAARHRELRGSLQRVLVEGPSPRDPARYIGRSRQHRLVHFPRGDEDLRGREVRVRVVDSTPLTLAGTLEEAP